ncbi:MAG: hypothetical protein J4F28_04695, partial [Nitrosopumilaceae archaeon]|nr:hypothetical protein [Nitrosopumilaceae archaeon]
REERRKRRRRTSREGAADACATLATIDGDDDDDDDDADVDNDADNDDPECRFQRSQRRAWGGTAAGDGGRGPRRLPPRSTMRHHGPGGSCAAANLLETF